MSSSLRQILVSMTAGLIFCLAVTFFLFELKQIFELEAAAAANYGTVKEVKASGY